MKRAMVSFTLATLSIAACGPESPHNNAGIDAAGSGSAADARPDAGHNQDPDGGASGPVHVVITADNAYSFGYGDSSQITNFTQGTRAQTAGQIFNCPIGEGPEVYDIPAAEAPEGAYLYIVTWDDLSVTQGVLATFARDTGRVLTGDARFEVCATGLDYSSGPNALTGPDLATINQQIAICNAGSGAADTTSKGWVTTAGPKTSGSIGELAVGEDNSASDGDFPITCQPDAGAGTDGISADAHWMWYQPDPSSTADAFRSTGSNTFRAFLIFRLGADVIIGKR